MSEFFPIPENIKHQLDCKTGKHKIGNLFGQFSYKNHTYTHAQCKWCKENYHACDGKEISGQKYDQMYDEWYEHRWDY